MEQWKHIEGTLYHEVSSLGRIRSIDHIVMRKDGKPYSAKGQLKKTYITKDGYEEIAIKENAISLHISVHRVVAIAFIPNPQNKPDVNHKDGNTRNNTVQNLEWVTKTENMQHALRTGLWHPENRRGEKHPLSKLTKKDVYEIRNLLRQGNLTQREIAKMYSVCEERICRIKQNKTWI